MGAPFRLGTVVADFATLQQAIDAAASGDTILLRGGHHGSGTVTAKSLTIVSSPRRAADI